MISFKLSELAEKIDGTIIGADCIIYGVASVFRASEGDIAFLFSSKFIDIAKTSRASAFVVTENIKLEERPQILVKNPSLAQARILRLFYPEENINYGISDKAFVSPLARLGDSVKVMDFAYISDGAYIQSGTVIYPYVFVGENVKIGKNVRIFPHAVIMNDTEIGDNSIIYPGAVIGSDGFGYAFNGKNYEKIPQVGKVILGKNTEIGANTTIDRATLDETVIGDGCKIDNLVMIAHNVKLGENTVIAGQSGIAGSTEVGKYVVMGGQVGIADHVKIGNNVMIGGQSGVVGNVEDGKKIAGIPALDYKKWLRIQAYQEKLPEIKKTLDQLIKKYGINLEDK